MTLYADDFFVESFKTLKPDIKSERWALSNYWILHNAQLSQQRKYIQYTLLNDDYDFMTIFVPD